jgi:hypothetical protein
MNKSDGVDRETCLGDEERAKERRRASRAQKKIQVNFEQLKVIWQLMRSKTTNEDAERRTKEESVEGAK